MGTDITQVQVAQKVENGPQTTPCAQTNGIAAHWGHSCSHFHHLKAPNTPKCKIPAVWALHSANFQVQIYPFLAKNAIPVPVPAGIPVSVSSPAL